MRVARMNEGNAALERILKCRVNGKCKGCDLSVVCKKFRKFIKDNSQCRPPDTHTARMMGFYAVGIPKKKGGVS